MMRILDLAEHNLEAMELYTRLLESCADAFSPEEVRAFAADCGLPEADALPMLLGAAAGLRPDEEPQHRLLYEKYLLPALRPLDAETYARDPYYAGIAFPEKKLGRWAFRTQVFAPYAIFPCGDTLALPDGREIQPLGYFTEPFPYPAVLQDGREWMTVTPNEVETMRADVAAARGHIAVFGLGLGYYAFMAARKSDVTSVTVIELDAEIISLFQDHLLPQFPEKHKIRILHADAFQFLQNTDMAQFDFCYFDIWHNVADGVPLYLELRRRMAAWPHLPCRYWIEQSMLIWLRGVAMDGVAPLLDGRQTTDQ